MAHTAENLETQTRVLRSMREQNVAGLIMSPALGTPDALSGEIQAWGIPLVLVMRPMGPDWEMKPRPTAVVCYNDQVAVGVLHELDRMGKRAGKALAVVGCDNVVAAEHTNPPLTTLSAGADRLGTIASEALLARLNETAENQEPAVQYFAVPDLVVRESSVGAALHDVGGMRSLRIA